MMNKFIDILKIFIIVVILVITILYIFLVTGVIDNIEFKDNILVVIKVLGAVIIASVLIIFVNSSKSKN